MLLRILLMFSLFFTLACSDDEEESPNPKIAITIETQPVNVKAYDSLYTSFSVSVTGTEPKYQWYRDGEAYSTTAQCDVRAVAENVGVDFYCVISNEVSSVTSATVQLTVLERPAVVPDGKGMVRVPSGGVTAPMGSVSPKAIGHEGPVHNVKFTNDFWMDKVPVSEADFEAVMNKAYPAVFYKMPWGQDTLPYVSSPELPATYVNWNDAVLYCNAKNSAEKIGDSLYQYTVMLNINYEGDTTAVVNMTNSLLIKTYMGSDTTERHDTIPVIIDSTVAIIPEDTIINNPVDLIDTTFDTTATKMYDTTFDASGKIEKIDSTLITVVVVYDTSSTGEITSKNDTLPEIKIDTLTKVSDYKRVVKTVVPEIVIELTPHNGYYLTNLMEVTADTSDEIVEIPVGTYVVDITNDTVTTRDTLEYSENYVKYKKISYIFDTIPGTMDGTGSITEFPGYRLPTEAEWEFAVRNLSGSDYFWGSDAQIGQYAWYEENSKDADGVNVVQNSAQLDPNVYGLYDMSGNVWEWCHDYYGAYSSADVTDPTGPVVGTSKIRRGGSARDMKTYLRSSERGKANPLNRSGFVGLRIVKNAL